MAALAAVPGLAAAVRRADRPLRLAAFSLALPLLLFLTAVFVLPIGTLLLVAVENPEPRRVLPQTYAALDGWDGASIPDEPVFEALAADLVIAQRDKTAALLGKRLNYELPGFRSKILAAARAAAKLEAGAARPGLIAADPFWGDLATWTVIARNGRGWTAHYILNALDLRLAADGALAQVPPEERVYVTILGRTLMIAALVTLLTLLLGYPVAYVMAIAPAAVGAVLLLLVLLPLWTSLLVRTTAWVVLLQTDGVINEILLRTGLAAQKLQLIFTRLGTVLAMVHIQLPFTILPIYSVMRGIPSAHLRAARSLGAPPVAAFWLVYAPQTLPGVVAGCLITFILSLGYYITPALVGGATDQMMSSFIAASINRDLNWGLAAALGAVLLAVTLAIYLVFLRLAGAERLRLG